MRTKSRSLGESGEVAARSERDATLSLHLHAVTSSLDIQRAVAGDRRAVWFGAGGARRAEAA